MNEIQTRVLLITPPFTQLNTPYPATAYLKGFLKTRMLESFQMDLGIEVILQLFSKKGLTRIFDSVKQSKVNDPVYTKREKYIESIDEVIAFLQKYKEETEKKINSRKFLPESNRFSNNQDIKNVLSLLEKKDQAKYLATLYIEDIGDFITNYIDNYFGFSRYAERIARSANEFDEIYDLLQTDKSIIEEIMLETLDKRISNVNPNLVCFSVPFPGNVFSAFRCAQFIRAKFPQCRVAMGGGYSNTELRSVSDSRVFEFFDFISLDDGERPLLCLMEYLEGKRELKNLKRTFAISNQKVEFFNGAIEPDFSLRETGTPIYSDLPLDKYISVLEVANPMHRLWSDGIWNKLTLAHGCYWAKCTFCDVSLDYIQKYEPVNAKMVCDRVEELIQETKNSNFHFVDEAAPPSLMKEFAIEVIRRKLKIKWWTNIRFEKNFTDDLSRLLYKSGCIAVSGGLEVASDRLLKLIDKGVTVEQVSKVTNGFTKAGIMVHAYLMYGYPTQTIQETIDSLEMVRQMFEEGILQSGHWHQFALTTHSPIGKNPEPFGVGITSKGKGKFANNDLEFKDKTGIDHSNYSDGLKNSLYNYMHGVGFDFPLKKWFDFKIPESTIPKDYIHNCINQLFLDLPKDHHKLFWIGDSLVFNDAKCEVLLESNKKTVIKLKAQNYEWLKLNFENFQPISGGLEYKKASENYSNKNNQPFSLFFFSKEMDKMRKLGLIVI